MTAHNHYPLLRHFLVALAYRTRKVLRDAPEAFASFDAGHGTRTALAVVRHMSDVLNHARTFFGGPARLDPLSSFEEEVDRFFAIVGEFGKHLLETPEPS